MDKIPHSLPYSRHGAGHNSNAARGLRLLARSLGGQALKTTENPDALEEPVEAQDGRCHRRAWSVRNDSRRPGGARATGRLSHITV